MLCQIKSRWNTTKDAVVKEQNINDFKGGLSLAWFVEKKRDFKVFKTCKVRNKS